MTSPVRIPSDVDMTDRVIGPLTARQLTILAVTGLVLYAGWSITRAFLPVPVFLALAIPVGAAAAVLALGQRDGVSLDRMVLAAIRQRMRPRLQVAAPEGIRPAPAWLTSHTVQHDAVTHEGGRTAKGRVPSEGQVSPTALRLPAEAVTDTGVIDLGSDGLAVVAACSTVNFGLRTPTEQESLVASFGRYLHSLTAPVQVLVRTERLDVTGQIAELRDHAGGLPHPALESAAREHADYLVQLAEQTDLLRRQVLLVLRESVQPTGSVDGLGGPSPLAVARSLLGGTRRPQHGGDRSDATIRRAAESRLVRRLSEAASLLAPTGITVTGLDAGQATAVLASACNPDTLLPPSAGLAGADDVITTASEDTYPRTFGSPDWRRARTDSDVDNSDEDWDYDDDFEDAEGGR